jgi:Family of unknown function (DUF6758)
MRCQATVGCVTVPPSCPRCGGQLRAPSLVSSDWRCAVHGAVHPLHVLPTVTPEVLAHLRERAKVPIWMPMPLLPGWTVTGAGYAGDERSGGRATALAYTGPAPLGGAADLVLVAEEPGVGLGAGLAGLPSADPGTDVSDPPAAKIVAAGHPTALWTVQGPDDRSVFVGEAKGLWLWAVLWPAAAGYLLAEHVSLHDLRDHVPVDLVVGAPSPYLTGFPNRPRNE